MRYRPRGVESSIITVPDPKNRIVKAAYKLATISGSAPHSSKSIGSGGRAVTQSSEGQAQAFARCSTTLYALIVSPTDTKGPVFLRVMLSTLFIA